MKLFCEVFASPGGMTGTGFIGAAESVMAAINVFDSTAKFLMAKSYDGYMLIVAEVLSEVFPDVLELNIDLGRDLRKFCHCAVSAEIPNGLCEEIADRLTKAQTGEYKASHEISYRGIEKNKWLSF